MTKEQLMTENLRRISAEDENVNFDRLLQTIVLLANEYQVELGITLNVRGLIVSGMLVSDRAYFDGITQEVSKSEAHEDTKKLFHTTFAKIASEFEEENTTEISSKRLDSLPKFIHLRTARMYPSDDKSIPNTGVWWRGRISEVSGFGWGLLK